jgi:hypothetical protein
MISLEKTLLDQETLSELCSDTPPKTLNTSEIFAPNGFYGNDLIYKLYSNLPISYPLKFVLPHAPDYLNFKGMVWDAELLIDLPEIWCYSNQMFEIYSQAIRNLRITKDVVKSASPFIYLLKLLETDSIFTQRRGTIFFPSHSTHHITDETSYESLAAKLDLLEEEYKPITVCVYWRDFNLGRHLPFVERGMRVVSAGHMYDPAFLFRFYHLCSLHKYSCANNYGTAVLYSIKSGCSYFHLDTDHFIQNILENIDFNSKSLKSDPANYLFGKTSNAEENMKQCKIFADLFATPKREMTREQINFVDKILGCQFLKSSEEVTSLIMLAETKYVNKMKVSYGYLRNPIILIKYLFKSLPKSISYKIYQSLTK